MIVSPQSAREHLHAFDFRALFVEELGWDRHRAQPLEITVDGQSYRLDAVAEKRGMAVYTCEPATNGATPDYATRRKIEKAVAKVAHEHVIIYADAARTKQVWQWVKREPGRPDACRESHYYKGQTGDLLIQKLRALAISIEDEEKGLTITDVVGRARQAFDVDRVTRRFYDRFQAEHKVFLEFIQGIQSQGDRAWYASLMLNRLMFIYFIQKKGFLDGDVHYLRNRLRTMQERKGRGSFHSFYRHFLLRLFHEGLGRQARTSELDALLGKVPYLNGGLFDVHELERKNAGIEIPDEAFERIFDFFDAYHWHLDERPLRADNEINPDVLGYIFEKYINQKQMGAYYTKEDITTYIAKNTIIPFLFDAAEKKCAIAFRADGAVWGLLRDDPDRYIYPAVRKGVDRPLPDETAAGLHDFSRRGGWNRPAAAGFALPTETWREHVARRTRYEELRAKLAAGDVRCIDDLITLNLDIRQLAQDAIANCEGPELLRAFYAVITAVTVLDPTCGSGAFLFAALNILQPLYDACLDRMQGFVDDLDHARGETPAAVGAPGCAPAPAPSPAKFADFRKTLARVEQHPNRDYFILKSIIIGNLYGVDIMEEAVEICKLRLFLKLVAQVERVEDVEPLPDVDFNIRAGNTLVGFAGYAEVQTAVRGGLQMKMDLGGDMDRIDESAEIADRAFQKFHEMQTEHGMDAALFTDAKHELRRRLDALRDELDRYLAREYGIEAGVPGDTPTLEQWSAFEQWRTGHRPFHWFVEFYGIMKRGGFDVIIGNPPYVVYSEAKVMYRVELQNYATLQTKNLYALVYDRSMALAKPNSRLGLIVQLTVMSSERLPTLQDLLMARGHICALSFPRRPESIFDGVEMPVAIVLSAPESSDTFSTSRVSRFYTDERSHALALVSLIEHSIRIDGYRIAKIGSSLERSIYRTLEAHQMTLGALTQTESRSVLYYQEACRYWVKACRGVPFFRRNGVEIAPPHGRTASFQSEKAAAFVACLANSSLFYWYYSVFSDCEHINDGLIRGFRVPSSWQGTDWIALSDRLSNSLAQHARRKTIATKQGHSIEYDEIRALHSKPIIDEIDCVLARHYGFTDEELDFIINYDIKYRMGQEAEDE